MTRESLLIDDETDLSIHIRDGSDGPVDLVVTMTTERRNGR